MTDCCAGGNEVMLLACAGGSNVGQLSNRAAVELTREGFGKIFCLAGIGAHLSGFVQSAKDVPNLVAIDGCAVGCVKAMLAHMDIAPAAHVVLTEAGIEKNGNLAPGPADAEKAKAAVRDAIAGASKPAAAPAPFPGACDCGGKCC